MLLAEILRLLTSLLRFANSFRGVPGVGVDALEFGLDVRFCSGVLLIFYCNKGGRTGYSKGIKMWCLRRASVCTIEGCAFASQKHNIVWTGSVECTFLRYPQISL